MGIRRKHIEVDANQLSGVEDILKWFNVEYKIEYCTINPDRSLIFGIALRRLTKGTFEDFLTMASEANYTIAVI